MRIDIKPGQITRNFNISEFVDINCDICSELYIDENFFPFVLMLQEFRDYYGRPININSGFRNPVTNKKVGGSRNSAHLKSNAVDFNLPSEFSKFDTERKREFLENVKSCWCILCDKYGYYPQVNFYDTYLHLGISTYNASFIDERSWK